MNFTVITVDKYISLYFAVIETETQKENIICIISQGQLATPPYNDLQIEIAR